MTDWSSRTRYGKGCGPDRRADDVEGIERIGHPVTQRFVDGGTQCLVSAGHRYHFGAEETHAPNVGGLTLHVDRTHVDNARQTQPGTGSRGRHAVLTGTGLGDDPLGSEALCQQCLADGVVDLMRAGMRQILALQPDLRAPPFRKSRAVGERRGAADPALELLFVFGLKIGGMQVLANAFFQALQRRNEGLGHKPTAEGAETALGVREFSGDGISEQALTVEGWRCHRSLLVTSCR